MRNYLNYLENQSIFIIREAYSKIRNSAILWSMGKDSTVMLHLVRKAFMGHCPLPLVHIDTGYKIPEMIEWRDAYVKKHNLRLIIGQNNKARSAGMSPEKGRLICCGALKTTALIETIRAHKIQGLFVGIRRDEEGSRSKERIVSPRTNSNTWSYKNQPAEIWEYYNLHVPPNIHVRIHPILHWNEIDIWHYIRKEKLEIMPLYFSRNGRRYRSLGCAPCTADIRSNACTVDGIIAELYATKASERAGRAQDKADTHAMQKLRSFGYM